MKQSWCGAIVRTTEQTDCSELELVMRWSAQSLLSAALTSSPPPKGAKAIRESPSHQAAAEDVAEDGQAADWLAAGPPLWP
jgi:hypothetical protein